MNILPMNLQLIVTIALFQGFLVLIVIFLFLDKIFSSSKFREQTALIKENAYQESIKILADTKAKAHKLLLDAEKQASEIITRADIFNDDLRKNYENTFHSFLDKQQAQLIKVTEGLVTDVKESINKEKITTLAGFTDLTEVLKSEIRGQIDHYGQVLTKNALETEEELKDQRKVLLEELQKNLDTYEAHQKEKIKEKAFKSLVWINKEFFSSAISLNDHETLINKILEEDALRQRIKE